MRRFYVAKIAHGLVHEPLGLVHEHLRLYRQKYLILIDYYFASYFTARYFYTDMAVNILDRSAEVQK